MDFKTAALAIYSRLDAYMAASHAGVPVLYENRLNVDLASQEAPFVACEIVFNDGVQTSLGVTPSVRYHGAAWLSVWVKKGSGISAGLGYLGDLSTLFKTAMFGGVVTRAPVPVPAAEKQGWHVQTLRVPFYFDQLGS